MNKINCNKCIYYYITWDKINPKGCKFFKFKSKQMPSIIVLKSSGNPCKAFIEKK
ncbi:uracil-DNA glycosylase [Helicovermis profundi]|uniref:Uracil-DNA glycosylase n=1 Tax=Helicovermis profundi TaxID=3065157 RepID=A0AAU9E028_9FIRM|nr:hypothetical protein HLPR_00150 [Clostridia bacterium S502]